MKKLIGIFSLICLTYTAFGSSAFSHKHPESKSELATVNNSTPGGDELTTEDPPQKTSSPTTFFNFVPFSLMRVDSVPTISTFGGTDRFRKATTSYIDEKGM